MMDASVSCLERVRAWRWPQGIHCPHCGAARWHRHERAGRAIRPKYRCGTCLRVFNDLTGTPFARSRLPLERWFECAEHMNQGRTTCAELARRLGVKVATAWRLRRVLRRSFSADEFRALFIAGGS